MGRWATGAITTGQCLQLNIKSFVKEIKKGNTNLRGSISWESGASITVKLTPFQDRYNLELDYSKTDREGKKHPIKYTIPIISTPSNLGKGVVYYFFCPFKGKRCKVLYMGYGSHYFKCREAYQHRIYYRTQIRSKFDRHIYRYHDLNGQIEQLEKEHPKTHYRGKQTAIGQRIEKLKEQRDYHDCMRWKVLPVSLQKFMNKCGISDAREM